MNAYRTLATARKHAFRGPVIRVDTVEGPVYITGIDEFRSTVSLVYMDGTETEAITPQYMARLGYKPGEERR